MEKMSVDFRKNMEKNIYVMLNKVLALLLMALGYNSCHKEHGEGENVEYGEEYGCPHADYVFRGKVTDGEGNALPGVKISLLSVSSDGKDLRVSRDSLSSTDEDGAYSVSFDYYSNMGNALRFTDKDGTTFDTLYGSSPNLAPLKGGGGGWYQGASENTMDIKLNK